MGNNLRRLRGTVESTKMEKTVIVRVDRSVRHRLYGKVIRSHKIYLVHDEIGVQSGDKVMIVETKPISKRKRFAVQKVLRPATEAARAAESEVLVDDTLEEEDE